jgi:hypothetical protein
MRSVSSTGTARAESRPIRRSCNPSPPSASYRPLQRRNVRSVIPSISAASAIVTSRRCRRSYSSSNRICLTSCRILARVRVALLEGAPKTGQITCDKKRTDDMLSTQQRKGEKRTTGKGRQYATQTQYCHSWPIKRGEGHETIHGLSLCASATPTAAPAADQPISLSSPLALWFLALPAPHPPAHTSDTTSTTFT